MEREAGMQNFAPGCQEQKYCRLKYLNSNSNLMKNTQTEMEMKAANILSWALNFYQWDI